jgi:DNA-binding IclR family transcriptional regulator
VHATALGKAILGAMDADERNAMIDELPMAAVTPDSIIDKEILRAQIEAGLDRQCFVARNEGSEGVCAVGIAGRVGARLTALSIVGPTHRVEKNLDAYMKILMEARTEFFEN